MDNEVEVANDIYDFNSIHTRVVNEKCKSIITFYNSTDCRHRAEERKQECRMLPGTWLYECVWYIVMSNNLCHIRMLASKLLRITSSDSDGMAKSFQSIQW